MRIRMKCLVLLLAVALLPVTILAVRSTVATTALGNEIGAQTRPADRVLALLDPLLGGTVAVTISSPIDEGPCNEGEIA